MRRVLSLTLSLLVFGIGAGARWHFTSDPGTGRELPGFRDLPGVMATKIPRQERSEAATPEAVAYDSQSAQPAWDDVFYQSSGSAVVDRRTNCNAGRCKEPYQPKPAVTSGVQENPFAIQ